jgi:ankyrin repeat protein
MLLHAAAVIGRVNVVRLLLKHDVDREMRNNEGKIACELAKSYGHEDVVRVLEMQAS